jgi:prepilin-type N-terminal cleavage/methylation domain-containing protein
VKNSSVKYNQIEGFSLLEVLIALLILSITIISIAKLQTTSFIRNYDAYLHSTAAEQLASLFERLQVSTKNQEIITWKQNIAASLPQGQGEYDFHTKTASICWFNRFLNNTRCLRAP